MLAPCADQARRRAGRVDRQGFLCRRECVRQRLHALGDERHAVEPVEVRVRAQILRRVHDARVERVERSAITARQRFAVGLEGARDPVDRVGRFRDCVTAGRDVESGQAERRDPRQLLTHRIEEVRVAGHRVRAGGGESCDRRANQPDLASRCPPRRAVFSEGKRSASTTCSPAGASGVSGSSSSARNSGGPFTSRSANCP